MIGRDMDNTAKGFAQKIVSELEKIYHVLLNTPRQQDIAPAIPENASHENNSPGPLPASSAQTKGHISQSNRSWYMTLKRWKTIVEMSAIPFAIGYAVVTWVQWRDLRRNFTVDERAWLYVSRSVLEKEPSDDNRHIRIQAFVIDSGKTPALAVGFKTGIFLFDHDPPMVGWRNIPLVPQGVLFPGQTNGAFIAESELHGASDLAVYKSGQGRLYLRSCLLYTDVFNKPHFTESCVFHIFGQPLDTWTGCNGNTVDGSANQGYNSQTSSCGEP
jgi:hypothetical protein